MKKRFVSLGLASLLLVGAWFLVAFRPAHSRIGELRADVDKAKVEVSDLEAKVQRLLALQRNESGSRDEAKRRVAALPGDPKVSDFIIQVQDAANGAGIDFLSIAPSLPAVPADIAAATAPAAPAGGSPAAEEETETDQSVATPADPTTRLRSISVQIKADGEFFEIEQFVLRLEQLARALRIDDFSLAGEDKEQTEGRLSSSIKLQMFMMTPQAAVTTTPGGTSTQGTSEGA
jgi:Tfp pilus assembly protein PilO